ncbi:hypothetical protein L204_103268 [Cryptococcus depauperatus]
MSFETLHEDEMVKLARQMNIALAKQNPHEEFATAMSFEAVHGNEFYCPPQDGSAATIVMTTGDRKTSPM